MMTIADKIGDEKLQYDVNPRGFSKNKNVSSKKRVKPWFFMTFNIIISHMFRENFIEIPEVFQKI